MDQPGISKAVNFFENTQNTALDSARYLFLAILGKQTLFQALIESNLFHRVSKNEFGL
jgi:hypothetical protein